MDNLARRTVLASATLEREQFRVTENSALGLIRLQTFHRKPGAVDHLAARLGAPLPGPGTTRAGQDRQWFWSAPGEWVIAVRAGTEDVVLAELRAQLDGLFAVLSVMTDSRIVLDVGGASAREVLARGSTVDFHPSRFGAGSCVLTRFAGVPAMLACPYGGDVILLFADRSQARYLLEWFEAASVDCE